MRNAVITGATKGIGRAIAIELAQKGYNIAVCARSERDLALLKEELAGYGIKVLAIPVNCADKQGVIGFAETILSEFKEVDVLVNNVGIFRMGSLLDETDEIFEEQLHVNLNTAYYLSKRIGKAMQTRQFGHIFNICSVASKQVVENAGSYSVTKAAMLSLNHVLRKELAPYKVKVTAILPGATLTSSWQNTPINEEKFVRPQDIAKALSGVLEMSAGANVEELTIRPLNG